MRLALTGPSPTTGLAGPVAIGAGLLLLGLAPLIRGGNRHVALILLEWLSLILLLVLAARAMVLAPRRPVAAGRSERFSGVGVGALALAPLWVGLIQLTPVPNQLWAELPGRASYAEVLAVAEVPDVGYRVLSLVPDQTVVSLLAGLPLSAAFLLAFLCSARQLVLLVKALVVFAVAQAILGLLQMGPFPGLSFGAAIGGRAIGTFANPNHFASYIAMTVPLAILALRQSTVTPRERAPAKGGRQHLSILWGVGLFLLLSAVLASGSRGGTVTCLVVTLLAVLWFPMRQGHRRDHRRWRLAGAVALLALVALAVGVDALMSRFESDKSGYLAGDRWQMVIGAWHAAVAFWPFGSGLGSFAAVFPTFHPAGVRGFVEHAHNDYVELLMEGGLLAVALWALALTLSIRQIAALVRRAHRHGLDPASQLQASCGLGLLAVLLHSWVDFNLRIPANAMLAAFLLGAFLRPPSVETPAKPAQPMPN